MMPQVCPQVEAEEFDFNSYGYYFILFLCPLTLKREKYLVENFDGLHIKTVYGAF